VVCVVVYFASPDELGTEEGLDLRKTIPPVPRLLAEISASRGNRSLFALSKTHPQVIEESVGEILRTYPTYKSIKPEDPEVAARVDYMLVQLG
jgi:hypothetical protein